LTLNRSHYVRSVKIKLKQIKFKPKKNPKTMKTAKERFEAIVKMIDADMIPEDCEVRLWINNCTNNELLHLGAELGIACDRRSNNDTRLFLCVEKDNYEITLWA
jgi:hypothetical protein